MSNVLINKDSITSDFKHSIINDKLVVEIDKSSDLVIELDHSDKDLVFNFAPNTHVSATVLLKASSNNSKNNVELVVQSGAYLNVFIMSDDTKHDIEVNIHGDIKDNATVEFSNGAFAGASTKYHLIFDLNGVNARALHNIAAIALDNQKKDFDVTINNNAKSTYAELNNFGVVKDTATLVFSGTGYMKKGAKNSVAHQASRIITFDPKVIAKANPFLIIDEADVLEASHAAAVGKMDEEQLFYLRSRGLNKDEASKLITYGYLKPILSKISDEKLKEKLEHLIEEKVGL